MIRKKQIARMQMLMSPTYRSLKGKDKVVKRMMKNAWRAGIKKKLSEDNRGKATQLMDGYVIS